MPNSPVVKYPAVALIALLFLSDCLADTFTDRLTGESFNGHATSEKRGSKTQVRIDGKSPQYLNPADYEIRRNALGRKNSVYVFAIKGPIELVCETEAFEEAIGLAVNQGPLFILIEIDTPGGRADLAGRICDAIIKAQNNCNTVAFIGGDAFAEGATVALACKKIYMAQNAAIGAAPAKSGISSQPKSSRTTVFQNADTPFVPSQEQPEVLSNQTTVDPNSDAWSRSQWQSYSVAIAERNGRAGLIAKAMEDKDIEVIEVSENDRSFFIDANEKTPRQTFVRKLGEKGSALTLTADQAIQTGIADKIVGSQEQIFADLAAADAREIRDTRINRARLSFERTRVAFDRIMSSISGLEQQVGTLSADIETLDNKISIANGILSPDRYGVVIIRPGRVTYKGVDFRQLQAMIKDRDDRLARLSNVLDGLIRNYNKAIPLANKTADLRQKADALAGSLKSAQDTFVQVGDRLRMAYWR